MNFNSQSFCFYCKIIIITKSIKISNCQNVRKNNTDFPKNFACYLKDGKMDMINALNEKFFIYKHLNIANKKKLKYLYNVMKLILYICFLSSKRITIKY